MVLWNTLLIISLSLLVISCLVLLIFKFRKNVYYKVFVEDELFESTYTSGVKTRYFFSPIETRPYISRYVIRSSSFEKALVCNYAKEFKFISYHVVCYSKKKKVIDIVEVNEIPNSHTSRIIPLHRKCRYVNIYVKSADGFVLNSSVVRPIPRKKISLYSFISSVAVFNILFILRHLLIVVLASENAKDYMFSILNYAAIAIIVLITLFYFGVSMLTLRNNNKKYNYGGMVDHEFF